MANDGFDFSRFDKRSEEGRRPPRRATVKKVESVLKRRKKHVRHNPMPVEPPTDETLLLCWLFRRIDQKVVAGDREITRNVRRSNAAALLHGKYEGGPSLMTLTAVAEYVANNPDDVDLERLREQKAPRQWRTRWA
jgi:hypothetical protein